MLASAKPRGNAPCRTPPIRPRERAGHDSIARLAPAGHSAPIPMPSAARTTNRNVKLGENPATKLHTENHSTESISGVFRPTLSASQPEPMAPTRRSQSVSVSTEATAVTETPNSLAIGTITNKKIVKSNASSIHPKHAANQANHWSLVGSFHHATDKSEASAAIASAMPFPPAESQRKCRFGIFERNCPPMAPHCCTRSAHGLRQCETNIQAIDKVGRISSDHQRDRPPRASGEDLLFAHEAPL